MNIGDTLIGAMGRLAADAKLQRSKEDFVRHGVALLRGLANEYCLPHGEARVAYRDVLHTEHENPLMAAREYLEMCDPGVLPELCAEVRSQLSWS